MAPGYNLCKEQQEPKVSVSVHLTNRTVSWWLLNDGNDLHSFIFGWELLGYSFRVTVTQDLDNQFMRSDVCHLGKISRQCISGE